jgi:hypothetical protein
MMAALPDGAIPLAVGTVLALAALSLVLWPLLTPTGQGESPADQSLASATRAREASVAAVAALDDFASRAGPPNDRYNGQYLAPRWLGWRSVTRRRSGGGRDPSCARSAEGVRQLRSTHRARCRLLLALRPLPRHHVRTLPHRGAGAIRSVLFLVW